MCNAYVWPRSVMVIVGIFITSCDISSLLFHISVQNPNFHPVTYGGYMIAFVSESTCLFLCKIPRFPFFSGGDLHCSTNSAACCWDRWPRVCLYFYHAFFSCKILVKLNMACLILMTIKSNSLVSINNDSDTTVGSWWIWAEFLETII